MEIEEEKRSQPDLFLLLGDFLRQARQLWILGLALIVLGSAVLGIRDYRSYSPRYEAYASFTVRVTNPLYASTSSYNSKTAEIMAKTFPSILTSGVLQSRIMESLGLTAMPALSVTASAEANIFTLTVRDSSPERAHTILGAVIEQYPEVAELVIGSTSLVLLDESGIPAKPINARNTQSAVMTGAVMGAAVWLGIVLLLTLLKNTIHNEDELKRTVNTPCLGQIPSVKIPRQQPCPLLHRNKKHTGFGESVRLLRLRVEKTMEENQQKVLLISSAVPGEGKTTVSANLAISLAQKGNRVLLVDCDLRNPSVVKALNSKSVPLGNQLSLADYLAGKVTVMDIIQPTSVNNLSVISGGNGSQSGNTDLLAGRYLERLVQAGKSLYDYVILDTPPCSLLADASEVADLCDCALMVIRQDYASQDQILDGMQRLSYGKLTILGCVLNNMRKGLSSGSYGYSYGYGYGYGYSSYGNKTSK